MATSTVIPEVSTAASPYCATSWRRTSSRYHWPGGSGGGGGSTIGFSTSRSRSSGEM